MPIAGTSRALHTAEDAKTLIRILLDLHLGYSVSQSSDAYTSVDLVVNVRPANVSVVGASLSAPQDANVSLQEIARWTVGPRVLVDGTSNQIFQETVRIHADIKAMRKFKEGDALILGMIAGTDDNAVKIDGNIYTWFKE